MGCCASRSASESFRAFVGASIASDDTSFGALCHAADLFNEIREPSLGEIALWKMFYRHCHGSLDASLQERLAAEEQRLLVP
jgi:hypothetical protein